MAITTQNSTQHAKVVATPQVKLETDEYHGRLRALIFNFVQSGVGDAGSLIRIGQLPSGRVRLILPLCFIAFEALGSSRTMDMGWEAYTDDNGDAVVADPNGLDDGVDVSSAGTVIPAGTLGGNETKLFASRGAGPIITLQINDAALADTDALDGILTYVVD